MEPIMTKRLVLRNFRKEDAAGLFDLLANPRVNCFTKERMTTVKDAIDEIKEKEELEDGTDLAVCLLENNQFIGTVYSMKEEPDTYSVCWNFLKTYEGKGYAFEAATAYLNYLFDEKEARRIYAYVEDDNLPSQNLCKRLGMRMEGCFMEFISFVNHPDGTPKYENTMQFAILKKEWKESRK